MLRASLILASVGCVAAEHVCVEHTATSIPGHPLTVQVVLDEGSVFNKLFVRVDVDEFLDRNQTDQDIRIDLDDYCRARTPFRSLFLSFGVNGHPSMDGFDGGYGIPHYDVHFYNKDADFALGLTCPTVRDTPACDFESTDPSIAPFWLLPPAEQTGGFYQTMSFGGHAITGHGNHWLPNRDDGPGGPAHTDHVNNEGPNWLPCAMQADGAPDMGCRFGKWGGLSPILISYNAEVIGMEPMVSLELIQRLKDIASTTKTDVAKVEVVWPSTAEPPFPLNLAFAQVVSGNKVEVGFKLDAHGAGAACKVTADCVESWCSPNKGTCQALKAQGKYCNVVQICGASACVQNTCA